MVLTASHLFCLYYFELLSPSDKTITKVLQVLKSSIFRSPRKETPILNSFFWAYVSLGACKGARHPLHPWIVDLQPLELPFPYFRVLLWSKQDKELTARKSGFKYGLEFSQVKEIVPQISGTILKMSFLSKRSGVTRCRRYVSWQYVFCCLLQ